MRRAHRKHYNILQVPNCDLGESTTDPRYDGHFHFDPEMVVNLLLVCPESRPSPQFLSFALRF